MSRFPILRAELDEPAKIGWTVLQPYFLCPAAVRALGIELDSRKGRVAVTYCESELQRHYIEAPLRHAKPERALDEAEMAAVQAQALAVAREWRQVAEHFGDEGPNHGTHTRQELKDFLLVREGGPAPGKRQRLSPLAARPASRLASRLA